MTNNSIKILAFGKVKDITGWAEYTIEEAKTLNDIWSVLIAKYPNLNTIREIQFAVNEQYVQELSIELQKGDLVALIPPVSGG